MLAARSHIGDRRKVNILIRLHFRDSTQTLKQLLVLVGGCNNRGWMCLEISGPTSTMASHGGGGFANGPVLQDALFTV
jgi:hypothetical protein